MQWILDLLFPPRQDERIIRDVSVERFLELLSPGIVDYTQPGTVALLPFHNPVVRAAIHEAKYHGNAHALRLLGAALADYIYDADTLSGSPVLVPVPLGPQRAKDRGYNQTALVASDAKLPHPLDSTLLVRTRETPTQVSLARDKRAQNLKGAFTATRHADETHTYIVFDDVITTGATLQAAIDALRAAGAVDIIPLALAH